MAEDKNELKIGKPSLKPEAFVIPEGYEIVVIGLDGKKDVDSNCTGCGGSSLHTDSTCQYCGIARTHYEYKKVGEGETKRSNDDTFVGQKIIVSKHELMGSLRAEDIEVGEGSAVGSIEAKTVYMSKDSSAGVVSAPVVRTQGKVTITEMGTSDLNAKGRISASLITVYDGGSLQLPFITNIAELRLGEGVQDPNAVSKLGIKQIVRGQFPPPSKWKEDGM